MGPRMGTAVRIVGLSAAAVAVAAGLIVAVAASQPAAYSVERRVRVAHPPEVVWPLVSDYRRFVQWSPWEGRDPDQVATFSEPSVGLGAWYAWEGNGEVGRGRMETTGFEPPLAMVQRLEFIEPFSSVAEVRYDLAPDGEGTLVRWSMRGEHDMFGRLMSVFVSFDSLIGPDFEQGLASLAVLLDDEAG